MSIGKFDETNSQGQRKKKSFRVILGIGVVASAIAITSTLAANININSGPVEFGQGVAQTTACDGSVTITPASTFINEQGQGDFLFTSFAVSDISEECIGKVFTIKAFSASGVEPLGLYRAGGNIDQSEVQVRYLGSESSFLGGNLLSDDITSATGTFTVSLVTLEVPTVALAMAKDVYKLTIESSDVAIID